MGRYYSLHSPKPSLTPKCIHIPLLVHAVLEVMVLVANKIKADFVYREKEVPLGGLFLSSGI